MRVIYNEDGTKTYVLELFTTLSSNTTMNPPTKITAGRAFRELLASLKK